MRHVECIGVCAKALDPAASSPKPIRLHSVQPFLFMRKFVFNALTLVMALAFLVHPLLLAGTDMVQMNRSVIPRFTLDQAILTALQRNADIQRARQEIERTKGLYIALRAQALPRIDANTSIQNTDPHLGSISAGSGGGLSGVPTQYSLSMQATQVVFAGGRVISQIRSADFQRDASYYAFRDTIDQVIATVKQQFYQILLNRALVGVQEESIKLLEEPAAGSAESVRGRHGPAFQRPASAGGALESVSGADHRPKQLSHRAAPARENVRARFRSGSR